MNEKIAYLGPEGAFSHAAAQMLFPEAVDLFPFPTIPDVLTSVDQGVTDSAVVPIENAIEGAVNLTVDWFIHHVDVPIVSELIYPISQCLMIHPLNRERPLSEFLRVYSHPQAIAQCRNQIRSLCPQAEIIYTNSTAQAAQKVSESPNELWVSIGSHKAAELYNLFIRRSDIQDHGNNFTRFVTVSRHRGDWQQPSGMEPNGWKTTLQVTLPSDFPGALHQVLSAFAWRKINLTYIESRPTKMGLGNYFFIIDAAMPQEHVLMRGAMAEMKAIGCSVRILGSYPSYQARTNGVVKETI